MITENKEPMKYVLFLSVFFTSQLLGQERPAVEYKDGARKLWNLLEGAYTRYGSAPLTEAPDSLLHYLTILFSVDSTGKIGDQIFATTIGDTLSMPKFKVTEAIRTTSGAWINHTGRTIWVEQTFTFRYKEMIRPGFVIQPVRTDVYEKGAPPLDFLRLEVISVEACCTVTQAIAAPKE
jgi:hypothetical protein